ncbi:Fc receptor-like protein 5 [Pelodiscus sinensis]|uniref:Fc receptor-like protein 5 n=1 Tax=Pelodiscus sinensis TaxID=13735 RepID=UPI003F6B9DE0
MAPTLLPVLAFLQFLPRPAAPTDGTSPMLSVNPTQSTYRVGHPVTFTCTPPKGYQATQIQFLKDGEDVTPPQSQTPLCLTYHLPHLNVHDSGSYRCRYWPAGLKAPSTPSDPITLIVYDRAPPASLTVDPPCPKYLVGEQLTLTCMDPQIDNVTGYRFYNEENGEIFSRDPDASRGAQVFFPSLRTVDAGSYTCKYWQEESGQEILSVGSQPVSVSVLDSPSPPALSMDPPSGVIKEGLPLLLTCTAPQGTGERRFYFYKDGVEFLPRNGQSQIHPSGSRNISVLRIPRAQLSSTGAFTCRYEENVCQKWGPSPRSQAVYVTVTGNHAFLVRFLAVGGSFFLINGLIFLVSHRCL